MHDGYFAPRSVYWRVAREWVVALSGARALLMQFAHPLVAAGVVEHSNFRNDMLGRLHRTIDTMTQISFGNVDTARNAIGHMNVCHAHVEGILQRDVGALTRGTKYRANDMELKLWVHATLVDSMPRIYDLFVAPLSRGDREDFYRDSRRMAALLGIPAQVTPATYTDFDYYMDAMLESDALTVGADARQLVGALFAPRVLGPFGRWASFAGIGLLPARWREEYGFTWDEKRERRLQKLAILSRRIRPFLPEMLCVHPRARAVEKQQGVVKNL